VSARRKTATIRSINNPKPCLAGGDHVQDLAMLKRVKKKKGLSTVAVKKGARIVL
jgi:hypothetical protein